MRVECWKCSEAIRMLDPRAKSTCFADQIMVGCDLAPRILSYGDAETMCPKGGVDTSG